MAGLKRAFDMIQAEMDEKDNIIEKQRMKIEEFESHRPLPSAASIIRERLYMTSSFEDARTILNSLDLEGGPILLEDIQNPMCHIQLNWSMRDKRWKRGKVISCSSIFTIPCVRICGVCGLRKNGASVDFLEVE